MAERSETGKTYGTIANDAGKLEEYQTEMLQIKKDVLAEKVAAGLITQERVEGIAAAVENNQISNNLLLAFILLVAAIVQVVDFS
ncbi:MAG TPA: hypothetical protein VM577_00835 [Anaerovoracaceae bacterium]|nr:hypothetical protein [Anaerovoracaceae bacterium]